MTFSRMVKPVDMARRGEAAIMQKVEASPLMQKAARLGEALADVARRIGVLEKQAEVMRATAPSATRH